MKLAFWRRESKPSEEAVEARKQAGATASRAADIYSERRRILTENHFAERIRLIYEGNR